MSDPAAPQPPSGSRPHISSNQMKSTVQGADRFDLAQVGLALLIFIASLLPFYTYSVSVGGFEASESFNAWHGFFGWFGVLLALAAAGLLVASMLGVVAVPSMRLVVLGLFAAAAVCLLLALFVTPGGGVSGPGYDDGHGFGYWLALLCSLGAAALAFLRKDASS